MMDLVAVLQAFYERLLAIAPEWGLDATDIDWRVVESDRMYELVAYALPGRLAHWTHGRDFGLIRQRSGQGHGRFYEIVFGGRPATAYLLDGNTLAAQKLVMAHVLGHVDLDRTHMLLAGDRADRMASFQQAQARLAVYQEQYGLEAVETVLNRALAIQWQVSEQEAPQRPPMTPPENPYPEIFSRPTVSLPPPSRYGLPTTDLLGFLARESTILADWERDICASVRQEGLYFHRLRQVKQSHEGYAAMINQQLLLDPRLGLTDGEQVETAVLFAHVASPDPTDLNPYWFGGRFLQWLVQERGWAEAQAIWRTETDASLVRNYCTADTIRFLDLYRYQWAQEWVDGHGQMWIARRAAADDWEGLRDALANALAQGPPVIRVGEMDYKGTLQLIHEPDGTTLDKDWAAKTCAAITGLWGAPVILHDGAETITGA